MQRSSPAPILVDGVRQLESLAAELARRAEVAFDTEADSFYAYREKVCLVQISTDDADYIVDPLAPLDLGALAPVFASDRIRKVFHDAEYDVALLKAAGIGEFRGLFDTRIGVALLGSKTPGLSNVLRERYGIELDKSEQRSDWRRRPLSDQQLRYARDDTRHLLRLARDVESELARLERLEIFRFECERVAHTEPRERAFDADEVLRFRGARELDPHGLSALRELAIERDRIARGRDLAPFRVAPNEALVLLARAAPRDARDLDRLREMPRGVRQSFGDAALEALERARANGPWQPPPRPEAPPDEELDALDRLKRWRTKKSEALGFDASAVLNRRTLEELARTRPTTVDGLAKAPGIAPWQVERFGGEILEALKG